MVSPTRDRLLQLNRVILNKQAMPKKQPTPEQKHEREKIAFSKRIEFAFKNAGFLYLPVRNKTRIFGAETSELDAVFLFENILLICEETVAKGPQDIKDHLRKKKMVSDEITKNRSDTIEWLKKDHFEKFKRFQEYSDQRYKIFFLYFTKHKFNPDDVTRGRFNPIRIIEPSTLNYFHKLSQNIRFSSRSDIFRFLGLKSRDIGQFKSSSTSADIDTAIICPQDTTGHEKPVIRLISFMLSAEFLIRNSYVLRKDSWEDDVQLYQRLIEKNRIKSIREHVAKKKITFYNNIVVSLPNNVSFVDSKKRPVNLEDIHDSDGGHKVRIPDEFNSIGIVDGQHRVFAHYEGEDKLEKDIKPLREKLHLLVTGLIFPEKMNDEERRKYESEIFLDINSNARRVPPDVLLFIETLNSPSSGRGIARKVLVLLNQRSVFHNLFELSLLEKSKIKIASIIKFALCRLVTIDDESPNTLYALWKAETRKSLNESSDGGLLEEYVWFIVNKLDLYFSALKSAYPDDWDDGASKILSTTSINGFIMALRKSLGIIGFQSDHKYYEQAFRNLDIDFNREEFRYTSSQYNKFSIQILNECFGITEG